MFPNEIKNTTCKLGRGHLLSIANCARLMLGELFNYEKCLYIDSDTIIQKDIYTLFKDIDTTNTVIYAYKSNDIKLSDIFVNSIHNSVNELLQKKYILTDKCYYTGTFLVNCKLWKQNNILDDFYNIINIHNSINSGLYKFFTMSIMNIVLYGQFKELNNYISITHELIATLTNICN